MAIKERKFVKTDIIFYDIREFIKFEECHFWNAQPYDIALWTDSYNEDFAKLTQLKNVFFIGDDELFASSDFDNFMEILSKAKLRMNGLFLYVMDVENITKNENLEGLLIYNQQTKKLAYYPSLAVENEKLWCGGIFIANEKISQQQMDELCIGEALFIGGVETGKKIKKENKLVKTTFTSEETNQKTLNVWEQAWKLMKKVMSSKDSFCIISTDPDNFGVLLSIYYLMNIRGYSYHEASKYVIFMRFKINLPQPYQTFLRYLFISPENRPESPKIASLSSKEKTATPNKTPEPEFKIEDTFQMKLRKKKLPKVTVTKHDANDTSADAQKLQKLIEILYSQVKKKLPQLERTTKTIIELTKYTQNLKILSILLKLFDFLLKT
jgi:hypothetical protein